MRDEGRFKYGMFKWIAESLEVNGVCLLETVSRARLVQRYLKMMGRLGRVEVKDGVVHIRRVK